MLQADHSRRELFALLVIFVGGCLLRVVSLAADVDYYDWIGYLTDEGRWVENARNLFLFGEPLLPRANTHLWIAPLFQALSYLAFLLFDLSRLWARMLPAVCGCAILLMVWTGLRRHVSPHALMLGLALVAVQEDLVMLSRVAIPEIPSMLVELSVFLTLLRSRDGLRGPLLAGGLMAICVAMKATTAPMFAVFGMVAWFTGSPGVDNRKRRLLAFWTPALIIGAVVLSVAFVGNVVSAELIGDLVNMVGFIRLNSSYNMVSLPFNNSLGITLNTWLLGVWLGILVVLVAPDVTEKPARRWLLAATIWAAGYGLLMLILEYFPNRYKAHALVPLAILVTFCVDSFYRLGLDGFARRMRELSLRRHLVASAILALPSAVLVSPSLLWFLDRVGLEADALRWKLLVISAGWLFLTAILHRQRKFPQAIALLVPVTASLIWLAGKNLFGWDFWLGAGYGSLIRWLLVLGVATIFCWLLELKLLSTSQTRPLASMALAAYCAFSVAPFLGSLLWPQFSLRDASRDIGVFLRDYSDIGSYRAEGFFIDNDVPYDSLYVRRRWRENPPRIMVSFELYPPHQLGFKRLFDSRYKPLRSYSINVSSRYQADPARVTIYRLNQ